MTVPVDFQTGHVKRDPVTGAVAVRSIFPETDAQFIAMAWLVATPNIGARNAPTAEVSEWEDLYVPTVVVQPGS